MHRDRSGIPHSPGGGTTLSLSDDSYTSITLSGTNTVAVYGTRTNVVHVASNGYLTLRNGELGTRPRLTSILDCPGLRRFFGT